MLTVKINGKTYETVKGTLLSELLAPTHTVEMPCGGRKSCGKCKVVLRESFHL